MQDTRIEKLIAAFESNGWTFIGPVDSSDWWYSEILQLSSTWRPVNSSLYLTFLTDPEFLDRKIVWAVGISSNIPGNAGFDFIAKVTLNELSKIHMNEFVKKINETILR
jgi:hypothetical protein